MKKIMSMLLVMMLLAGCASKDGSDNNSNGGAKGNEKKITIRTASMYGGTDPGSQNYRNIMNKFMEDYPNVTIEDERVWAGCMELCIFYNEAGRRSSR